MSLTKREVEFLHSLIEGVDFSDRAAMHKDAANPLDNSYWKNLIFGSIKGLTEVAKGSMDWKLTAIVKLFQSWLEDKEAEQTQAGFASDWNYQYHHTRQYHKVVDTNHEEV